MFSTSMMASSTTTPTEMTNPARIIVLMVTSRTYRTIAAAMSDSGIATRLISAVRHSKRNTTRITKTRMLPRISAFDRLCSACSMKLAGRKIV